MSFLIDILFLMYEALHILGWCDCCEDYGIPPPCGKTVKYSEIDHKLPFRNRMEEFLTYFSYTMVPGQMYRYISHIFFPLCLFFLKRSFYCRSEVHLVYDNGLWLNEKILSSVKKKKKDRD